MHAERAQRLAVERGGADEAAGARALEHEPEAERDGRAEEDDEQVVVRDGRADGESARSGPGGRLSDFCWVPQMILRHVAQDEDERVGEEELVQLLLAVEVPEEKAL